MGRGQGSPQVNKFKQIALVDRLINTTENITFSHYVTRGKNAVIAKSMAMTCMNRRRCQRCSCCTAVLIHVQ